MSEQEQEQKSREINLDELTVEQSLQYLTSVIRSLPFTYAEHVNLEQCRRVVEQAVLA